MGKESNNRHLRIFSKDRSDTLGKIKSSLERKGWELETSKRQKGQFKSLNRGLLLNLK